MDDDRKAPPQVHPADDDRKPAADAPPPKRQKSVEEEVVDIVSDLHFQPGDRLEVKWTINDDEEEGEADAAAEAAPPGGEGGDQPDGGGATTVWWPATLNTRTDRMHAVTEREMEEASGLYKTSHVSLPIYNLNYSPLEEFGFDTHSLEEVAFISNTTLLNLSTDEIMVFRRAGEPSPPPTPVPDDPEPVPDDSAISREFHGEEEMATFMNQLMQKCMKSTGMDKRMEGLPAAEQIYAAERIKKAKEGFLAVIMNEMEKMESGKKVVTADVVRKCTDQMKGRY